jgi:hypothetical protein
VNKSEIEFIPSGVFDPEFDMKSAEKTTFGAKANKPGRGGKVG